MASNSFEIESINRSSNTQNRPILKIHLHVNFDHVIWGVNLIIDLKGKRTEQNSGTVFTETLASILVSCNDEIWSFPVVHEKILYELSI